MDMSLFNVMLLFLQFFYVSMVSFKQISRLDLLFLLSALDMY